MSKLIIPAIQPPRQGRSQPAFLKNAKKGLQSGAKWRKITGTIAGADAGVKGGGAMRVITGTARGRHLKQLEGMETRPTTDRVKEALFSVLQFDIEGRRVLDLFAGTGQLGIECLSRGAESCVFVDRRADAVRLIRENLALTELTSRARVIAGDSMAYLKSVRTPFDIILLDPPYSAGLLAPAIAQIARHDLLAPHGYMTAEHPVGMAVPALAPPYRLHKTYRYGKIAVTVYRRAGDEPEAGEP